MKKLHIKSPLGRTGIEIPRIIYGTSYLGNLYRILTEKEKLRIVKKWFECTERPVAIDSAGKYGAGLALETIGKLLEKEGISPEDVIISNKLAWYQVPLTSPEPGFEKGVWAGINHDAIQKISYTGILECWEQGSRLLGKKYKAALLSVHDPDEYLNSAKDAGERERKLNDILEAYRALFDLKTRGEIKAVGVGSKDWLVIKELNEYLDFDWVMFANKFTLFHHPKEIVNFMDNLHSKGTGIINSAVFNAGFLTGGNFFDYVMVDPSDKKNEKLFDWRNRFFQLCEQFKVKPSDACILFGLSHPAICSIALNTSRPDQMPVNVEVVMTSLPAEFWIALKEDKIIDPDYKYL